MEMRINNQKNGLPIIKSNPELERIAHELATQLIGYNPRVSATTPSVIFPTETNQKVTHPHQESPAS